MSLPPLSPSWQGCAGRRRIKQVRTPGPTTGDQPQQPMPMTTPAIQQYSLAQLCLELRGLYFFCSFYLFLAETKLRPNSDLRNSQNSPQHIVNWRLQLLTDQTQTKIRSKIQTKLRSAKVTKLSKPYENMTIPASCLVFLLLPCRHTSDKNLDLQTDQRNPFRVNDHTEQLLVVREREREFRDFNKLEKEGLRVYEKEKASKPSRRGVIKEIRNI